jgi:hypothetical protein
MDLKAEMIQRIKNKVQPTQIHSEPQPIATVNEKRPLPTPFEFTRRVSNFKSLIEDVKRKKVKFNLKSVPNPECEKLHHNVDVIMEKNKSKLINTPQIIPQDEDDEDVELSFAERQTLWNPQKSESEEEKEKIPEEEEEVEEVEEVEEKGGLSPGWETDKDLLPKEPSFKAHKMRRLFESQGLTSSELELLTREAEDVEKKLMKDYYDAQECIVSAKRSRENDDE